MRRLRLHIDYKHWARIDRKSATGVRLVSARKDVKFNARPLEAAPLCHVLLIQFASFCPAQPASGVSCEII